MGFWETVLAAAIGSVAAGYVLLRIGIWMSRKVSVKIKNKEGYIYADFVVHIKLTYKNMCQTIISCECTEARLIPSEKNNSEIILSRLVQHWERPASPGEIGYVNVEYNRHGHEFIPRGYSLAVLTIKFGRRPMTKKVKVPLIRKEKREE